MRGWPLLRLGLGVVYVLVLAFVVVGHSTSSSLLQLYEQVDQGAVDRVELEGGLTPPASGYAQQTVTWRTGWRTWSAELAVERPADQLEQHGSDLERTDDDVAAEVRQRDPSVEVVERDYRSGFTGDVYGTRVPGPVGVLALLGGLAALLLLVSGPRPYRATRWAWFWLSAVPGGALAFLALSGPTRGLRTPPPDEPRLTGGRAFLLSLVLGLVASAGVGLAAHALWPPYRP